MILTVMHTLIVFTTASVTKPEIMFYTNQTENPGGRKTVVIGLEGETVSLRCFFSGRSDVHACTTPTL